jgi:hypothetical protein
MEKGPESAWTMRRRLAIAVAIGAASALFAGHCLRTARVPSDFEFFWRAARAVLQGADPYAFHPDTPAWPLPDPFFYPLPAVLPVLPLALLPLAVAGALFMGVSGGLLAFAIARGRPHRLWLFASGAYVMALKLGQVSPLLLAAGFLPVLGVLRWRRAEGRLFLAMIAVPQELFFADQLPLQLIARTRRQSAVLAAASLAGFAGWYAFVETGDLYVVEAKPWVLGFLYGPALAVLLFGGESSGKD